MFGNKRNRHRVSGINPLSISLLLLSFNFFLFVSISFCEEIGKTTKFPSKHIRIIIPVAPGGVLGQEIISIVPYLEKYLGVKTIISYIPGADGIISYNKFVQERPDGYTISYFSTSSAILLELTRENAKFSLKNFSSIGAWNIKTLVMLVHPDRWKSFSDFLNEAKQRNVTLAGTGGNIETQYRLMEMTMGIKFNYVPYESYGQSSAAVAGKHVDTLLASTGSTLPMVRSGKLKAIALFAPKPDPFLPGVPTLKELGHEEVPLLIAYGMFAAPPNTPKGVVAILEKAISNSVADQGFRNVSRNLGYTLDFKSTVEIKKEILEYYNVFSRYKLTIKK